MAPVSMVSIPKSLAIALSRATSSGSVSPQLEPINPMVSYSRGETISSPLASTRTLLHLIMQPGMQAWEGSPPRSRFRFRM